MAQVGEKALTEVTKLADDLTMVLNALEVNNASNAVKKVKYKRAEMDDLRNQLAAICEALDVDNWFNAVQKGQKLVGKQD